MNDPMRLSEEEMDYLMELLNVGAGNAATALTHLLRCEVNVTVPGVEVLSRAKVPTVLGDLALPADCVRMKMVGDTTGYLYFIVPDDQKPRMAELAERALMGPDRTNPDPDRILATLTEIGNILAGVYLTAIHDFCGLNLCHSVPVLAVDMMQALLDESLAAQLSDDQTMILIRNEFIVGGDFAKTFFLIVPSEGAIQVLVGSMKEAATMYLAPCGI